jgi:hypothetical protein
MYRETVQLSLPTEHLLNISDCWRKGVGEFHFNLFSTFFAVYINMERGWYNGIKD